MRKAAAVLPVFLAVSKCASLRQPNSGRFAFRCPSSGYSSRYFLTGTLHAQASCNYYLLKSEPDEFSINDLEKCQEQEWDGVRNFQARNKLRAMKKGDMAFFYHSSCKVPGIVGTMRVVREAAPDVTALDPNHKGYDSKSTPDNCRWDAVRVGIQSIFDTPVTLHHLKKLSGTDEVIGSMTLLRQSRLSVHELTPDQWFKIMEMTKHNENEGNVEQVDHAPKESKVELVDPTTKAPKKTRKRKSSS